MLKNLWKIIFQQYFFSIFSVVLFLRFNAPIFNFQVKYAYNFLERKKPGYPGKIGKINILKTRFLFCFFRTKQLVPAVHSGFRDFRHIAVLVESV